MPEYSQGHRSTFSSGRIRPIAKLLAGFLLILSLPAQSPSSSNHERAAQLIKEGKSDEALTLVHKILQHAPQDFRAHNLLGIALSSFGRPEEAIDSFIRAYEINPNFHAALKNLALNELRLQRIDNARAHLEQFLESSPQDPAASLALAEIHSLQGEHEAALSRYWGSQGMYLRNPATVLGFVRSAMAIGRAHEAERALELMPPEADGKTHFKAGVMLAELGNYEVAAREFGRARKDYPDPYEAGYNQFLAYTRARKYDEAIHVGEEMILSGHKKAEVYNLLARSYEHTQRTVDAYNALRAATELEPREENHYLDLVALGIDHRNYALAFGIIEAGLQNIPGSYRLRLARGVVLAFQGQMTKALVDFEEAARRNPGKDLPYFGMVMALMQTDRAARAREILKQRLALKPDSHLLLYALGEMQDRIGAAPGTAEEMEAVEALRRSVEIEPNMAPPRIALGRMLLRRGEAGEAIVHLEKALALNPDDLSPAYQLATAYRRKGDPAKAAEYQAKFEQYKAEDRDRYMNNQILRLLREGEK